MWHILRLTFKCVFLFLHVYSVRAYLWNNCRIIASNVSLSLKKWQVNDGLSLNSRLISQFLHVFVGLSHKYCRYVPSVGRSCVGRLTTLLKGFTTIQHFSTVESLSVNNCKCGEETIDQKCGDICIDSTNLSHDVVVVDFITNNTMCVLVFNVYLLGQVIFKITAQKCTNISIFMAQRAIQPKCCWPFRPIGRANNHLLVKIAASKSSHITKALYVPVRPFSKVPLACKAFLLVLCLWGRLGRKAVPHKPLACKATMQICCLGPFGPYISATSYV